MAHHDEIRATLIEKVAGLNGGDLKRAEAWYSKCPLPELGGETAEYYVANGYGAGLLRYFENLSAGATG